MPHPEELPTMAEVERIFLDANREQLEACRGKLLAVTFSGGRDSSACLALLNDLKARFNLRVRAFVYAFPNHRYSGGYLRKLCAYWASRGVGLTVRKPDEPDRILEDSSTPCRVCQKVRKRALASLFTFTDESPERIVIVSGHSLWDLAAYAVNRLVANRLATDSTYDEVADEQRLVEISQRFHPFLRMPEGYCVFRPMVHLNQNAIELVCRDRGLPVLPVSCKYTGQRPKQLLSAYFRQLGFQFTYESVLRFAQTFVGLADSHTVLDMGKEEYLSRHF